MGNSFGCSASGERLVSAARDGDLDEVRMLLEFNPFLAKYSTFGGLNTPLHFAAAKGHTEMVNLLLQHGADVNSRNYCGQTALMHACRYGHWEIVQTLLLYKSNVTKADYLSGRTSLHFAAVNGHVRCIRLVVTDFIPSEPYESITSLESADKSLPKQKSSKSSFSKFVNKAADGGLTALHLAALNGHFDCVQLLLDINASVSAVTFHYGTSVDLIGAGSTVLHYAACGGNMKCCEALIAKGASRVALNCNGWLPLDVARLWRRHWLVTLLEPNSGTPPAFAPSKYLALPLLSIMNIAREFGLQSSCSLANETDPCAICLERACGVAAEGCAHEFCVKCALYLCSSSNITAEAISPPGSIPCPLCRNGIISFVRLPRLPINDLKVSHSLRFCTSCMPQTHSATPSIIDCKSDCPRKGVVPVSSGAHRSLSCTPFPSLSLPSCTCNSVLCPSLERPQDEENSVAQPPETATAVEPVEGLQIESMGCSKLFQQRRCCHREHQCNLEIGI